MTAPVSLIIPVYNREKLVLRTLQSIDGQRTMPAEIILVDNNSSDGSLKVISEWAKGNKCRGTSIKVLREPRPGAAMARQTGFLAATMPYVMFFDSDDSMHPEHIENLNKSIEITPRADIICWPLAKHCYGGGIKTTYRSEKDIIGSQIIHSLLSTQAYAVKTDFFRKSGGWATELGGWDDWELGLRLLLNKPKVHFLSSITVDVYEQGEASITGTGYGHRQGQWEEAIERCEANVSTLSSDPERMLRLLNYRRAILGAHYHREGLRKLGNDLLTKALSREGSTPFERLFLRFAYFITSHGIPGAGRLATRLL